MYFRKKQVVIEAVQFDGSEESIVNILKLGPSRLVDVDHEERTLPKIQISTLEGKMTAKIGDYIIKGVHGELYPCKPDIFAETYEECNEPNIMNFGQAIERIKAGKLVARKGWNGKGIYIGLIKPKDGDAMTHDFIYINTTGLQTDNPDAPLDRVPWLASQTDMLAEDWQVVGD